MTTIFKRAISYFGLFLFLCVPAFAEERKNLSIEDAILGFQKGELFYFEAVFQNGKYLKAFNKCLASMPADPTWMREDCEKHPEFKNVFQCSGDDGFTHSWFVYESADKCEEVRGPMKERMDAIRE